METNMILWPTLNAMMNLLATIFLIMGKRHITRGNIHKHKLYMIAAFTSSVLFLISYLTYHFTGTLITKYQGQGVMRSIYFVLLTSHSLLAIVAAPGALYLLWAALTRRFEKHKKNARWIWPVWIYVSTTGVLVYIMLYILQ